MNAVFEAPERHGESLHLAGLVHELRTPLAAIRAYAELLAGSASDPAFLEEASLILVREAERLDALIGNHLDHVRQPLHADAATPLQTCDLSAIAGTVAELLRPLAAASHRRIEVATTAAPSLAWGDSALVSQIIANLLGNALKHADQATCIQVRCVANDSEAWLEVEDDGNGIDPATASTLFEPFRTNVPRLGRVKGHGLGLWVAREFARRCGGDLEWVAREENRRGARFRLRLRSATAEVEGTSSLLSTCFEVENDASDAAARRGNRR